jgi:hypothetical protein
MKKLFVLLSILCFTMITAQATEQAKPAPQQDAKVQAKMHRENAFEKRLELTEVQKLKARQMLIFSTKMVIRNVSFIFDTLRIITFTFTD